MKEPKMFVATVKAIDKFKILHTKENDLLRTGADVMYLQLFCNNLAEFTQATNTLFGKIDTRTELERIFKVKL